MDMRSLFRTIDRSDLRDAIALAAAVGVVGASYGALAAAAGVPPAIAVGMSVLVLAGSSQFLVVAVVAAGGSPVAAVLGGLLLNARHLPFGLAMSAVVADRWPGRLLGAHILIDEVVAFSRARGTGRRARAAYWTCGVLLATFWLLGTIVGLLAGAAVPDPSVFGVDAAFPAALLALVLPGLRRADARRVGLTAAAVALAATPFLPPGLPVLVGLLGLLAAGRDDDRGGGAMNWPAVLTLAAGTYLLRLAGLVLRGRVAVPARVERYLDLGATALLVALVATAALTEAGGFAGWARPAGVAVGALLPGAGCRSCWSWCWPRRPPGCCGTSACPEHSARVRDDRAGRVELARARTSAARRRPGRRSGCPAPRSRARPGRSRPCAARRPRPVPSPGAPAGRAGRRRRSRRRPRTRWPGSGRRAGRGCPGRRWRPAGRRGRRRPRPPAPGGAPAASSEARPPMQYPVVPTPGPVTSGRPARKPRNAPASTTVICAVTLRAMVISRSRSDGSLNAVDRSNGR